MTIETSAGYPETISYAVLFFLSKNYRISGKINIEQRFYAPGENLMFAQEGFKRKATLLQSIPEYAEIVFEILRTKGELRGDANTDEFKQAVTWMIERELQDVAGLIFPTHVKNAMPQYSYHQVVCRYFWDTYGRSFGSFTVQHVRSPVVYGDDTVQAKFDGHDLALTYFTDTLPQEFKTHGVPLR